MRHVGRRFTLVSAVIVLGVSIAGVASATPPRSRAPLQTREPAVHAGTLGKVHLEGVALVSRLSPPVPPAGEVEDPGTDGKPPESGPPNTTGVVTLKPAKVAGASGSSGTAATPAPTSLRPSMSVVKTFNGEAAGSPPDTNVAANSSEVVEFVNSSAEVWSHAGTKLASFGLNALFDFNTPKTGCGDGRIAYDAASGFFWLL
jgi:hypothetical protein